MSAMTFDERSRCIACESSRTSVVWSATYDDVNVKRFMDRYGYAVDWQTELLGKPISLLACGDCSTLYHQHVLQPASLERLYSEWIDESQIDTFTDNLDVDSVYGERFRLATDNVRHVLRLNRLLHTLDNGDRSGGPPWRVLDFGCGAGDFLKQTSLFGFAASGVDFSTTRANQALEHQITILSSLDEYRDVASQPPHAITMFQVLEHLSNPLTTLRELWGLLAPGGILIVEVPDCREISTPSTFEQFRNVHPLEHVNAFTPDTLTHIAAAAGFEKVNPGPAHVTDRPDAVVRSELTRLYEPKRTNQYFRKPSDSPAP